MFYLSFAGKTFISSIEMCNKEQKCRGPQERQGVGQQVDLKSDASIDS